MQGFRQHSHASIQHAFSPEIKKNYCSCRAGRGWQLRTRQFCPALPLILMLKVKSMVNKMDKLLVLTRRYFFPVEQCYVFKRNMAAHGLVHMCTCMSRQRLLKKLKQKGWRTYVNRRWCSPSHIKIRISMQHIKLLAFSLRPYYLPRAFSIVIIIVVLIIRMALSTLRQQPSWYRILMFSLHSWLFCLPLSNMFTARPETENTGLTLCQCYWDIQIHLSLWIVWLTAF